MNTEELNKKLGDFFWSGFLYGILYGITTNCILLILFLIK